MTGNELCARLTLSDQAQDLVWVTLLSGNTDIIVHTRAVDASTSIVLGCMVLTVKTLMTFPRKWVRLSAL